MYACLVHLEHLLLQTDHQLACHVLFQLILLYGVLPPVLHVLEVLLQVL
jgi:hypothetical protein